MNAYSEDLRKKIVEAVERGTPNNYHDSRFETPMLRTLGSRAPFFSSAPGVRVCSGGRVLEDSPA